MDNGVGVVGWDQGGCECILSRPSQICILFHPLFCFFDRVLAFYKLPNACLTDPDSQKKGGGRGQGEDHWEQPFRTAGEADLSGQQLFLCG